MRGVLFVSCAALVSLSACRTPSAAPAEPTMTSHGDVAAETSTLYARDVTLSPESPENDWCGVLLVAVSPQGEATLRVLATGAELRASPDGYFSGEGFGRIGLKYVHFDPRTRGVTLRRYWCETTASFNPQ